MHVPTLLQATVFQFVMLVAVSFPAWRGAGGLKVAGPLLAAAPVSLVAVALFAKRAVWSDALTIVVASAFLLLAHQPKQVFDAERLGVDVQFSGHTHGGQIEVLKLKPEGGVKMNAAEFARERQLVSPPA